MNRNSPLLTRANSDEEDRCGIGALSTANDPFMPACKRHDHAYITWGATETIGVNKSRAQVDAELLRDMKIIIKQKGLWWLYPKAYIYYGVARCVGFLYWD
jgi:hypothetical protein